MRRFGVITLVLVCLVVGYYWHTPSLSPEASAWLDRGNQLQEQASNHESLDELARGLKDVKYPGGDCRYYELNRECIRAPHIGVADVDTQIRQSYRQALEAFPYKSSPLKIPDNGSLISGMSYDFAADLWQHGQIQESTLLFNMRQSRRALRNANTIFDYMVAVGLHHKAFSATAFTVAESSDGMSTELKNELFSVTVDADALRRIGQSELALADDDYGSNSELSSRKRNWSYEEIYQLWMQFASHYQLGPEQFWTSAPSYELTSFWRYPQFQMNRIATPAYQDYLDTLRFVSLTSHVLTALSEHYANQEPLQVELRSPEGWTFEWRDSELCLIPEFSIHASRVEEFCLNKFERERNQFARLQSSE